MKAYHTIFTLILLQVFAFEVFARSPLRYASYEKEKSMVLTKNQRGLHFTPWCFSSREKTREILDYYKQSNLNMIVIAMKTEDGLLPYESKVQLAQKIGACKPVIKNVKLLVREFQNMGIYTIARVVVFQDTVLSRGQPGWALSKNGNWTKPYHPMVWKYNLSIIKELVDFGFDEINFDYIRFPNPGDRGSYQKPGNALRPYEAIEGFLEYLYKNIKSYNSSIKLSADVFGIACMNKREDIEILGQRIGYMSKYLDYICPMNYPSHIADEFSVINNPRFHPYEAMKYLTEKTLCNATLTKAKVRPWIQDFSYRVNDVFNGNYVLSQIKAVNDTEATGWLAWNAWGNYSWPVYQKRKKTLPL
ncbi:MAG: putative glycoside hydrolase [bacterium]